MEVLQKNPDAVNFIKTVAEENGIKDFTLSDVKTNQKGEGFLGQIFIFTVQDTTSDRRLHLVVKASFSDEKIRKLIPIKQCFENEIYFYSEIYPTYKKFEQLCGISDESRLLPTCYRTLMENEKEFLCLEDLTKSKFEVFEKTRVLDHDHVELIFKTYGRLHAYSFALEDQEPEKYRELVSKVHNVFKLFLNSPDLHYKEAIQTFSKPVLKCLIPGEDDEIIKKFEKYEDGGTGNYFVDCVTKKCDYYVILQGDSWSNNFMFKYENSGNKKILTDLRLIDLQLTRLGSPVYDLSYSLYAGASKPVFDNLDLYLRIYYHSLCSNLKQLGTGPEKIFSFSTLKEEWKKHAKWGMIMGFAIWKLKTANREDLRDFTDFDENGKMNKSDDRYDEDVFNKRMKDILYHMSEIDAL